MAFDKKDGFGYLDNIPFKISTPFLPPPPIVMPTVLDTNEELSFERFQYDFSKEREILEDIRRKEENAKAAACRTENMCNKVNEPVTAKSRMQSMLSLQSEILLPEPQKVSEKVSDTENQNNSKINLSDFENDTSSPFDYMELQTINDLEELNSVFQGLNNKYSSDDNVYKDNNPISSGVNENLGGNVSKSMSFPLQNNDGFESSENYLTCPKEINAVGHDVWNNTAFSHAKDSCSAAVPYPSDLQNESLSRTFNSSLPKVPSLSFSSTRSNNVGNGFPDLVKSSLRGCKSYSDIRDLSEDSPKHCVKEARSSTPPSNMLNLVESKSDLSPVHQNEISPVKSNCEASPSETNCDNPSPVPGLPDPYNELSEEDRKFVDALADMGFPKAQVSRSVKHLGSDEKTVVEHLCQIQALEESGYDALEAEAALHLHDYNQDQAKQFLDLIIKFQDLGFEKNAVKKALIQNKNDWSKTIDALLS